MFDTDRIKKKGITLTIISSTFVLGNLSGSSYILHSSSEFFLWRSKIYVFCWTCAAFSVFNYVKKVTVVYFWKRFSTVEGIHGWDKQDPEVDYIQLPDDGYRMPASLKDRKQFSLHTATCWCVLHFLSVYGARVIHQILVTCGLPL